MDDDKPIPAFTTPARREQFFTELESLLDRYPEIANRFQRTWEKDPTAPYWEAVDGDYDPKSLMTRTGVVLIVGHVNMEMWEDISTLEPYRQTTVTTVGLIHRALGLYS